MPACLIKFMKFLFVLAQLGGSSCTGISMKQMYFAYCATLAELLFHYFN